MQCLIAIPQTYVLFVTDCTDVIAMTAKPDDWLSFTSELRDFFLFRDLFTSYKITYILRSENFRALAKCARSRGFCFFHVSNSVPVWLSLEESH
ncbi:hypothetical protein V5N11_000902 [Cardamine amara subsp. amara]|uniref:RNase H type-1 domain-containing protein n=1 Tax=Cardamine amara subsp. amara TaxID=228776 RepID=A0ABD1C526_CARAN